MIVKQLVIFCLTCFVLVFSIGQNTLFIPPTVTGSTVNLSIDEGTKQFYAGFTTNTIGYNGNFLGPTVLLDKWQPITFNVTNLLATETTTHWHGLHVAPEDDGSPHNPIAPGATWSPSFDLLNDASTYWYHPHLHETTNDQVVKGASGLIIVKDSNELSKPLPRTYGIDDFPLIVQLKPMDANKQFQPMSPENMVMVNGTVAPTLNVPAQVIRFRVLNGSNMRSINIGFGNNMSFMQIASDEALLNNGVTLTRLALSPGERAEILINAGPYQGQNLVLRSFNTGLPQGVIGGPAMGMGGGASGPLDNTNFDLLTITVTAPLTTGIFVLPTASLNNNVAYDINQVQQNRTFLLTGGMMGAPFLINNTPFNINNYNFDVPLNNLEKWTITNNSMVGHPFHVHDEHFFIVGSTAKKDVVMVPPNSSVSFLVKFRDFSSSTVPYMYHCHLTPHEDAGMMGQFRVLPPALPIFLIGFEAQKVKKSVRLFWQTENESNIASFMIQHSTDGIGFSDIGTVPAKGGLGLATYFFEHNAPQLGQNYYQLKQVSEDKSFEMSAVRVVEFTDKEQRFMVSNIGQNNTITIQNANQTPNVTVGLFNVAGMNVYQGELGLSESIDISQFAAGVYLLRLSGPSFVETFKILKK